MKTAKQILYFEGAKGGLGTTLISSQLALALAEKEQKVLILQTGTLGDLHNYLGYDTAKSLKTLIPYLDELEALDMNELNKVSNQENNLYFFNGLEELKYFDYFNKPAFAELLTQMRNYFDFIIIDGGSGERPLATDCLKTCDQIYKLIIDDLSAYLRLTYFLNQNSVLDEKISLIANFIKTKEKKRIAKLFSNLGREVILCLPEDQEAIFELKNLAKNFYKQRTSLAETINQFAEYLINFNLDK